MHLGKTWLCSCLVLCAIGLLGAGDPADCNGNGIPDEDELGLSFAEIELDDGLNVLSVEDADLDGDGDPDVLVSISGIVTFSWYRNLDGAGTLGPQQFISSFGFEGDDVTAADLDGDGDLDVLAALSLNDTVTWFENQLGGGTFAAHQDISVTLDSPRAVGAADLDGDGDLDVAAASEGDHTVVWFENLDGQGSFGSGQVITRFARGVLDIDLADLDGDGDVDIVAAERLDDRITWFENDGAGTFAAEQLIGAGPEPRTVIAVDLDGDHDLDVIAGYSDGQVLWHEKDGASYPVHSLYDAESLVRSVAAADFDGDADVDVMVAAVDVFHLEQLETRTFAPATLVLDSALVYTLDPGDLDGDGVPDVLLGDPGQDHLTWLRNDRDDCTSNGTLDACEIDCNANGRADSCDLLVGSSLDCDGSLSPDECETACTFNCDSDGDACIDDVDAVPGDGLLCGDVDDDGCDDCASGTFAPEADGSDADMDGICDPGDCDPADGSVWRLPAPVSTLLLGGDPILDWSPQDDDGTSAPRYDTLRSAAASDFLGGGVCIETNGIDTGTPDGLIPPEGQVFFYLVRVENPCSGGAGVVGSDSAGRPRAAALCP